MRHTFKHHIQWAELKFPPINLWVMASLADKQGALQKNAAHIHQRQRLGHAAVGHQARCKTSKTLHKLHRRLESLLAVRGGKV